MDAAEQKAAFEAQEARLRKIEVKIPRDWDRDRANKALRDALQGRVADDAAVLVSALANGIDTITAIWAREELTDKVRDWKAGPVLDGLHLTTFDSGVVNLGPYSRELVKADVKLFRSVLADLGLEIVDEWVATQGASWLHTGVRSVSFQLKEKP